MQGQQPGACRTVWLSLQGSRPSSRESSLPGQGAGSSPGSRPGTSERPLRAVLRGSLGRANPAGTASRPASASVTSPTARRQGGLLNKGSLPSFGRRSPGSAGRAVRPLDANPPDLQPRLIAGRRLLLPIAAAPEHAHVRCHYAWWCVCLHSGVCHARTGRLPVPQTTGSCRRLQWNVPAACAPCQHSRPPLQGT